MKRLDYPGTVEVLYTRPQLTHAVHGGTQRPPHAMSRLATRHDGIRRDPAHIAGARSIPVTTRRDDYDAHAWATAGAPDQEELERSAMSAMVASLVIVGSGGLALLGGVAWATVRIVRLMWGG